MAHSLLRTPIADPVYTIETRSRWRSIDSLFQLIVDRGDIGLQAAHVVVLVFFRQLDVCGGLVGGLAALLGLLNCGHLLPYEIAIFSEVVPTHPRAVARVDRSDALAAACGLRQSLGIFQTAAAVIGVHNGGALPGEQIAGVHDLQRREDDERIAAGVSATEVI